MSSVSTYKEKSENNYYIYEDNDGQFSTKLLTEKHCLCVSKRMSWKI